MILGKYNQAKTITFDLFEVDGIDLSVAATFAAGDIKIMKNEGAEANTSNLPTDEGSSYSLVLTATEMSAARIRIILIDQTATKVWLDISLGIETYGNASAEHAFDLDTAAETMRGTDSAATETKQDIIDTNIDTLLTRIIGTLATGTHNPATVAQIAVLSDWINGGRLDLILDIIAADTTTDIPALIAALNNISTAQVNTEVDTGLSDFFTSAAQLVDDIWDEILTGATHNIATSAGRRLRGIQEFQGYENGAIWIDTIGGTSGTVDYENGTVEKPALTWAEALTLNTSLGYNKFILKNGSSITLTANSDSFHIIGAGASTVALNGQSVIGITIENCVISGVMSGIGTTQRFLNSSLGAITLIKGTHTHTSSITGTQTVGEAGDYFYDRCHSGIAGTDTWTFNFSGAIGDTNLNWRNGSGGIQLENMGDAGTDTASIEGRGQIVEGTCTAGTVAIRGLFETSGITNLTLVDGARFQSVDLVDDVWDEVISKAAHNVAGSAGKTVRQSGDLIQLDGTISDATPLVTEFDTDLTGYGDGFFIDTQFLFANGAANGGISKPVTGYTSATGNFQFAAPDAWPNTPVDTDDFDIVGLHVHPISQIQSGLATEAKQDIIDTNVDDLKSGIIYGAAVTGTLSTTQATTDLTGYSSDSLIGRTIIVLSGAAMGNGSDITDYDTASGLLTFTGMTAAMANGDTFKIV